jgi:hypothetical protein
MSTQEVAEGINAFLWTERDMLTSVDHRFVSNYEAGLWRWPSEHYRAAFRAVLGAASDADLGFYIRRGRRTPPAPEPQPGRTEYIGHESFQIDQDARGDVIGPPWRNRAGLTETMEMIRRDLLRLLSVAGAALLTPRIGRQVAGQPAPPPTISILDAATTDELAAENARLWSAFASSTVKADALPGVAASCGC